MHCYKTHLAMSLSLKGRKEQAWREQREAWMGASEGGGCQCLSLHSHVQTKLHSKKQSTFY
jgi:hypothetical protein